MSFPLFEYPQISAPGVSPSFAGTNGAQRIPLPKGGFDLEATLNSGQVFHWEYSPPGVWQGLIGKTPVSIWSDADYLHTPASPEIIRHYFRLDDPLDQILATFPRTVYAQEAAAHCQGLRLIRQPFWECLATFLCSSMKQVAHIRQITGALRERYGEPIEVSATDSTPPATRFAFPPARVLAALSEKEVRSCGLGYRAKPLLATAARICEERDMEKTLRALPTEEARERLQQLPGVGPKIANCVLLFSLDRLEAVPVDVWIARVLQGLARRKLTASEMTSRIRRLGPYAGYVQQYYFHLARAHRRLPASTA